MRAVVAAGHTPGHTSYLITSASGERLIAFGDTFHSPAQLARPEWLSAADANASVVISARRQLLAELMQPDTFGFGVHFGDCAFGRVTNNNAGVPTWEPVPTLVHARAPRPPVRCSAPFNIHGPYGHRR